MIMTKEVERNAKIKILSEFVDFYQFEPKKGNQIPWDAAISQYWGPYMFGPQVSVHASATIF